MAQRSRPLLQLAAVTWIAVVGVMTQHVGIQGFKTGVVDVSGTKEPMTVECSYDQFRYNMTWTIITKTNRTLLLGSCYTSGKFWRRHRGRCNPSYRGINMYSRPFRYSSLELYGVGRNMGGNLTCSVVTRDNVTIKDDRLLNIYQVPTVKNCTVDTRWHNWSAVMTCDVTHAFSTADMYTFQVHEAFITSECNNTDKQMSTCLQFKESVVPDKTKPGSCVHHDPVSFRHNLTVYTNRTDSKEYYRGRLVYSWRLSSFSADKWVVRIYICAGSARRTCVEVDRNMTSSSRYRPSTPKHSCTDVLYVPESEAHRCVCTTEHLGTPEGRLVWTRGNLILATGGYGSPKQLDLTPTAGRVTWQGQGQEQGEQVVRCRVDWIEPVSATLPLEIAYGPDSVKVMVHKRYEHDGDANNNDDTSKRGKDVVTTIIIACYVGRLHPKTPDMVQWTGPCEGQQDFSCTLDPRVKQLRGQNVTCRVTNTANNGSSAVSEAIKVIDDDDTILVISGEHTKWAAIGGGVVLGVEALIALLLVTVVWIVRRRLPCCGPIYDSTKTAGNNATDAHLYEVIARNSNENRGQASEAQDSQAVYQNTSFIRQ